VEKHTVAYPIRSLEKGLQLLTLFTSPTRPVRLSEASRLLAIAPSTVHRMLRMMTAMGFVRQDPQTHAYFAGGALLDLAQLLLEEGALRRAAAGEMAQLARRTRETVVLCVLRGGEAHFIAEARGSNAGASAIPERLGSPAHATAAGKVLLAELSRVDLRRIYVRPQLPVVTKRTIQKRLVLERDLAAVRKRGYATSFEENRDLVHGVATGIRARDGRLYGSLSLIGPAQRLPEARLPAFVAELGRCAQRISNRLDASAAPVPAATA
jgi:IclR family acetate operon transcriptional repressor